MGNQSDDESAGAALTKAEAADLLDKVSKGGLWGLAVGGEAGLALGIAKGGFHWVWDRTREWYSASLGKEIEEHAEELAEGVAGLLKRGLAPHEVGIDFNALLRAWARASERSVGRKKRILMAALQHSLRADEEEYERGLGLAILEALESLDYGDIRLLREAAEGSDEQTPHYVARHGLNFWHLKRLEAAGMVDLFADVHLGVSPTPFGQKVLEYVHEGFAEHIASEERAAK